jgi:2-dehydro-3-deoxyphosphogluconate aldolase/(4S)-4-hydroxy-2-oxoglutarate aldolase
MKVGPAERVSKAIAQLFSTPVVPILTIARPEQALPLARALVDGGCRVLEVTLCSEAALEAIAAISEEVPEAVVGAGSIRSREQLIAAQAAGALFGVSPGFSADLAQEAALAAFAYLPGVASASEVMAAANLGFSRLKFFPAEPLGGAATVAALAAPFPDIAFCPTGGVTAERLPAYLALPNVFAVGCSWLAPKEAVAAKDWKAISELARMASALRGEVEA